MVSVGLGREWLKEEGKVCTSPLTLSKKEKVYSRYLSVPYCWLWKAVAEFYQTEELQACRKFQYFGSSPFDDWYYDKVIADCAEIVLMFGLSAVVAEARHFSHRSRRESQMNCRSPENKERQKEAVKAYSRLKKLVQLPEFWSSRNAVYSLAIPYTYWPSMVVLCKKIFGGLWRGSGYGGQSWLNVVVALQRLMYAWAKGHYKETVIAMDQLINLCHNNGLMLNKFNCAGYVVEKVLAAKQIGDSIYLSAIRWARNEFCTVPINGCNSKVWKVKEML